MKCFIIMHLSLLQRDECSSTEVPAPLMRQDGNQRAGIPGWTHSRLGKSCARCIGQNYNWTHASAGFLAHLENMWKRKAHHEVEQFREDLDTFEVQSGTCI